MADAHEYARIHAAAFRDQLKDLLRIPSISTFSKHNADVRRAAEWLRADMERIGITTTEVIDTPRHPVVYGEWLEAGSSAPTILFYGHYDVQPAEVADGWNTDPFDPIERDGVLYARGVSDDKGQVFAMLKAVESLLANGGSPVNIKLLLEGEEEISSINLPAFVKNNRDRLQADVCLISDSAILSIDQPSLIYALRGLVYMELHVKGPAADLHSGAFGGSVHNPAQALTEIIASLHNPDGSINVPGFYDDVLDLSDEERRELGKTNYSDDQWRSMTGAPQPWGEPDYTLRERIGARPTLEVNGLLSGFTGEGTKTVLPAKAMAKLSCRLVANQQPRKIYELLRDHIRAITPPTVQSELLILDGGDPALVEIDNPAMQAAATAYEKVWGKAPVFEREGGSIPIVADFQRELQLPVVMMGFGLPTDGIHGPNEHWHLDLFDKAIATDIHFLQQIARS